MRAGVDYVRSRPDLMLVLGIVFFAGLFLLGALRALRRSRPTPWLILAGVAGMPVIYAIGTGWFMAVTGMELGPAVAAAITPFVVVDAIKVALAAIVTAGAVRALPTLRR